MILLAEIGLTLLGLMAILRQRWALGYGRFLTGPRAVFLGMLCMVTIPVVFTTSTFFFLGQTGSLATSIERNLMARFTGPDINFILFELIIIALWATFIFGISGIFNWTNYAIIDESRQWEKPQLQSPKVHKTVPTK